MKKLVLFSAIVTLLPSVSFAENDLLTSLSNKMKFLNQRQSVISQNIANADTPGYKAKDLEPVDFTKMSSGGSTLKLRVTAPGQISGINSGTSFNVINENDVGDTSLNGNNVSLDDQTTKMAQIDMDYQKTVAIMRQMNGLIQTAVGGR